MITIVIIAATAVLAGGLVAIYNRLTVGRNAVENGWAQIDVQLTRRADLIPNLVETVKGYAAHETETLQAVTNARAAAQQAQGPSDAAAADGMMATALRGLFAVAEAYPQLRASDNFAALQQELAATETMIASSRAGYNNAVEQFNTTQAMFPANLVATRLGFSRADYFTNDDTATETAPTITF